MEVRHFINPYRSNDVWSFIVDYHYVYNDPFEFERKVLDLELDYFQTKNAVDIFYEDCFGKNGMVFVFTTEYNRNI